MGRKKGKQAGSFRSKAERSRWRAQVLSEGLPVVAEESVGVRPVEVEGCVSRERPGQRLEALRRQATALRSLLLEASGAVSVAGSEIFAPPTKSQACLRRTASWRQHEKRPGPQVPLTLLCARVVGRHFSVYSFLEFSEVFEYLEPEVLAVISESASDSGELNADNIRLLLSRDVPRLTLRGDLPAKALLGLVPRLEAPPYLTDAHGEEHEDWESVREVPVVAVQRGCTGLSSLSLSSPFLSTTALSTILAHTQQLRRLEVIDCWNIFTEGVRVLSWREHMQEQGSCCLFTRPSKTCGEMSHPGP